MLDIILFLHSSSSTLSALIAFFRIRIKVYIVIVLRTNGL